MFSECDLAFIHGIPRRISLHTGTLIIFVFSFVGLLYLISPYYFSIPYLNIYFKLFNGNYGIFILGLIAGYSMVTSVFRLSNRTAADQND
jgi:hypothetical protein